MELGPTGRRVAENLRRIRLSRDGMTTVALARRLMSLGWPISENGLTKTERGLRRVDADDLVALAVALEATPNALLLPGGPPGVPSAGAELLPAGEGRAVLHPPSVLWAWADGEALLPRLPVPPQAEQIAFLAEHRPHLFASGDPRSQHPDYYKRIAAVTQAAMKRGVPPVVIRAMTELAISEALAERENSQPQ